jgi:hypothetical protein
MINSNLWLLFNEKGISPGAKSSYVNGYLLRGSLLKFLTLNDFHAFSPSVILW